MGCETRERSAAWSCLTAVITVPCRPHTAVPVEKPKAARPCLALHPCLSSFCQQLLDAGAGLAYEGRRKPALGYTAL